MIVSGLMWYFLNRDSTDVIKLDKRVFLLEDANVASLLEVAGEDEDEDNDQEGNGGVAEALLVFALLRLPTD